MALLTTAMVLIGALALLNLLLTTAVIRRLREQAGRSERTPPRHLEGLVGKAIPEFSATTAAGATVTRTDLLEGEYLIGFFSAGCQPCHEQAPAFATLSDAETLVAVVAGDGPGADDLVRMLADVPVVAGLTAATVASAAGVTGFPTFVRVGATGTVSQVFLTPPQPRPAAALA